ncbi:dyschronic, isoform G [Anopheles sinensis]|uniref:Dyschronic, isoform G n=1 Tax=Anopheles sinensis TaxID=74873 RepID=A0A084WUH9_ANOSI|nr:dyschronic, isoform G [Anopheles sinensis]
MSYRGHPITDMAAFAATKQSKCSSKVSETDLEVIEATGRSPAEDAGLGLASTMPDIRNRYLLL